MPPMKALRSFKSITSVIDSGNDGLEVELSEPNAFIVPDLSIAAVRKPGERDIGTGAVRACATRQARTVLTPFPKVLSRSSRHRRDHPHEIPDATGRVGGPDARRDRHAARSEPRSRRIRAGGIRSRRTPFRGRTTFRWSSTSATHFANVNVRKAINEALDRDALVREGLNGQGTSGGRTRLAGALGVVAPAAAVRLRARQREAADRCRETAEKSRGVAESRFSFDASSSRTIRDSNGWRCSFRSSSRTSASK